jgi:hypothetical protein
MSVDETWRNDELPCLAADDKATQEAAALAIQWLRKEAQEGLVPDIVGCVTKLAGNDDRADVYKTVSRSRQRHLRIITHIPTDYLRITHTPAAPSDAHSSANKKGLIRKEKLTPRFLNPSSAVRPRVGERRGDQLPCRKDDAFRNI